MRDIKELTYSEFTQLVDEDTEGRFQLILNYNDFQVYKETSTGRYFYIECGENDASDFEEVKLVACLTYDINNDLAFTHENAEFMLHTLFDCNICGETINDDAIKYLWFKII